LFCQRRILVIAQDPVSIVLYVFTLPCFLASGLAFLNLKGETDKMRRLALAIALACALSGVVTRAGEIHTTGAVASPSPSPVTAAGGMHSTGTTAPGEVSTNVDAVLTIILTLISIVP
jgi:hypothetical protein